MYRHLYIYIYAQKTSAIRNQPEVFDLMGCTLTYAHLHGSSHNHSKLVTTAIRHMVPSTHSKYATYGARSLQIKNKVI